MNLGYTRIVSPVNGRVGLRQVDQGNYVTPGDANGIVVINQVQPITVIFPIPEDNVPALVRRLRDGSAVDRGGLRSHQQQQTRRGQAPHSRQ